MESLLEERSTRVNINQVNEFDGTTPLICAVSADNVEVVSLLLRFDADINRIDASKQTAFSTALRCPSTNMNGRICRLLLNDPNIDVHIRTPKDSLFVYAIQTGKFDLFESLIEVCVALFLFACQKTTSSKGDTDEMTFASPLKCASSRSFLYER